MRTLLNVACGATFAALVLSGALDAWSAEDQAGPQPWLIANGQPDAALYMPRDVQQAYARGTRSPDGRPGPNYWQNQAAHRMRISLSPPSRRVQGEQDIVYTNNSPDPLPMLVFRLYMDAHRPEAVREKTVDARFLTDGITVDDFSIDGTPVAWNDPANPMAGYNVPGSTIHALPLGTPIPPKSSVRIRMRWHYDLVSDQGWKEGAIDETTYFLAYFFPRITNYSDYNGWDFTPFTLGREFNNDFADFQVEVDVPRDYVVWATGTLQNPPRCCSRRSARGSSPASRATRWSPWPKRQTSRRARSPLAAID
jgi:hypothetical protein